MKEGRGAWPFPYTDDTATVTLQWGGEGERAAETIHGSISQQNAVEAQEPRQS